MNLKFNWVEYITFSSVLCVSALIGVYYGCIKRNQNTVSEYMHGGRTMGVFPIAMSLTMSHVSGITLLGVPAEVYEFGSQYIMLCLSMVFVVYITNTFYLPVFYTIQVTSLFEYLELRFSKAVRKTASLISTVSSFLTCPMIVYVSSLALHEVSGIDVHYITPVVSLLCMFYTSVGGFKAVVWTDTVQGLFVAVSTIIIIVLGIVDEGGISAVYNKSVEGERWVLFNMDLNPFSRTTFWTITIGSTFFKIVTVTLNAGTTQRFVALPTMKAAKQAVVIFAVGLCIVNIFSVIVGLIIYSKYADCDPMKSGLIQKYGELLPFYIQETARKFPGLTGIFISGLISAALSIMSACVNTLAGTIYEDFIKNFLPGNISESMASLIMKIIVVLNGIVCIFVIYFVEKFESILKVLYSVIGVPYGSLFAAFTLGVFFPWVNTKGVLSGMIGSVILTTCISTGHQLGTTARNIIVAGKSLNNTCTWNSTEKFSDPKSLLNFHEIGDGVFIENGVNPIFAISYFYYVAIGGIFGIVIGLIVSYMTGGSDLELVDPKLITPMMRRYLPSRKTIYEPVEQELSLYKKEVLEPNGVKHFNHSDEELSKLYTNGK